MKSIFLSKRTQHPKKTIKITLDSQTDIPTVKINLNMLDFSKMENNIELTQIQKKLSIDDIMELNSIIVSHFFFFRLMKEERIGFIDKARLCEVKKGKSIYE